MTLTTTQNSNVFMSIQSAILVAVFALSATFSTTAQADIFNDLIDIRVDDLAAGATVAVATDVMPVEMDLELEHSGAGGFDIDINPLEGCDFHVTLIHWAPIDGFMIGSFDWQITDIHMRDEDGDIMFAKITGIEIDHANNQMPTSSIHFTDWVCSFTTGSFPSVSTGAINDYFVSVAVIGDTNKDCKINLLDVGPFVDLLAASEYAVEADINQDGLLNLLDVSEFVGLLAE